MTGPGAVDAAPQDVKEEAYDALRALEFSAREARRLIKRVGPEMDAGANAEGRVLAALRTSRVDVPASALA